MKAYVRNMTIEGSSGVVSDLTFQGLAIFGAS